MSLNKSVIVKLNMFQLQNMLRYLFLFFQTIFRQHYILMPVSVYNVAAFILKSVEFLNILGAEFEGIWCELHEISPNLWKLLVEIFTKTWNVIVKGLEQPSNCVLYGAQDFGV
jgi:hypothetical protein